MYIQGMSVHVSFYSFSRGSFPQRSQPSTFFELKVFAANSCLHNIHRAGANKFQAAAVRGHLEIVQLLLNKGANVNAQGREYGNAIQAASDC